MADGRDPDLLQGLVRQARKDRLVYSFSRNAASYFPRPRLRSQFATSMTAPNEALNRIIVRAKDRVQDTSPLEALVRSVSPM
jgi:hypothetical protein